MSALIEFDEVCKYYQMGDTTVKAADHISMKIEKGEFVAIVGQSGSGKSTCMNIIGCLDVPTQGTYRLNGRDVGKMNRNELAAIRNEMLGFIFQQYNLLPKLNLMENVEVPLVYAGVSRAERHKRAKEVLEKVGLGDKLKTSPTSFPAASSSACPSPGLWCATRPSSWRTSPPALWTATPAARCWECCRSSTMRATPWSSSPTTIPLPCRRNASSGWKMGVSSTTATPTPRRRSFSPPCCRSRNPRPRRHRHDH